MGVFLLRCIFKTTHRKGQTKEMKAFKEFMAGLFYENGEPSLTRVLSCAYFVAFVALSAYLAVADRTWSGYEVFAAFAGGAGVAGQVTNKYINSRYNTMPGGFESKKGV